MKNHEESQLDTIIQTEKGKNEKIKIDVERGLPEIPEGWEWMNLKDSATIIMGQSPPSNTYNNLGEGLPFYQGKADFGSIHPTPRKWCKSPLKIALENDMLISVRAPVGPVNICKEKSCIGRGLAAIRSEENVNYKYAFYYFKSKEPELARLGKGSTFDAIKRRDLENLKIPLPPLEEQKRIVSRIEEITSRIEQAKKLREEAQKDVEAVMHSALNRVFSRAEEKGWVFKKIDEICHLQNGKAFKPSDWVKDGLKIIRIQNLNDSSKEYNYYSGFCEEKYHVYDNDILISWSGSLGTSFGAHKWEGGHALLNQHIFKVNFKISITKDYFVYAVNYLLNEIENRTHGGVGLVHITKGKLQSIKIPFPPIEEQKRIVAYLDSLHDKVQELRKYQEQSKEEIEAITQGVLRKAFKGEI